MFVFKKIINSFDINYYLISKEGEDKIINKKFLRQELYYKWSIFLKMEPIFIYYNNLHFEQDKNFTLEFSDSDQIDGVIFKTNKDFYITSMSCYIDVTVHVIKLP